MGGLFDLFSGGSAGVSALEQQYVDLRKIAKIDYQEYLNQFAGMRTRNMQEYGSAYQDALSRFDMDAQAAREGYASGMDTAYGTLASGRDSSLALLRQATEQAVARGNVSNAMTGLSKTSFGQRSLDAIQTQGTLQQNALIEQYAQSLASAQAARATGLAQMDERAYGMRLQGGLQNAGVTANMNQFYDAAELNARQRFIDTDLGIVEGPFGARLAQNQAVAKIGGSLLGSIIGAGATAIGGLAGGPAGAMMGSSIGGSFGSAFSGGGGGGGGGMFG